MITCSRAARAITSRPIRKRSRHTPAIKERIKNAKRVTGYFATRDYSYRSTQVAGNGWVLVGDAFGFLDPLYSSGVLLALKSGELAADAIIDGLAKGDTSAAQLGAWGADVQRGRRSHAPAGVRVLRRLQLRQLRPHYPELRNTVTDLLIGDLFTDKVDKVWGPMESLYPDDKQRLPTWREGMVPEAAQHKANELTLPEGRQAIAVFRYQRRVQFAETDAAGMVHFANFFRYMEEAEHALWRAAGMKIDQSWRRVSTAGREWRRAPTSRPRSVSKTNSKCGSPSPQSARGRSSTPTRSFAAANPSPREP